MNARGNRELESIHKNSFRNNSDYVYNNVASIGGTNILFIFRDINSSNFEYKNFKETKVSSSVETGYFIENVAINQTDLNQSQHGTIYAMSSLPKMNEDEESITREPSIKESEANNAYFNEKYQIVFPKSDADLDTSDSSIDYESVENSSSKQKKDRNNLLGDYELEKALGSGGHGFVIRIRNQLGENKAAKFYEKESIDLFSSEVCVLSMLSEVSFEDSDGWDIFETENFYGIIIEEGIGSLNQFKKFLLETSISLNEQELLGILSDLLANYKVLMSINFCHRDIKPSNILVYSNQLKPKLIDYGLAVYTKTSKISQTVAGTRGYIAPSLYQTKVCGDKEQLIWGDLFSIAITLLELAIPSYYPRQDDIEGLKAQLANLGNEKRVLRDILKSFLFPNEKTPQTLVKLSSIERDENQSLEMYYEMFTKYISEHFDYNIDYFIDKNTEAYSLRLKAYHYFKIGMTQGKFVENLKTAASYYLRVSMVANAILCYENIVKYYIQLEKIEKALFFCELILKELKNIDSAQSNSLVYSTLGICFYLKSKQGKENYRIMTEEMFQNGLQNSQGNLSKLILLNNNALFVLKMEGGFDKKFLRVGSMLSKMNIKYCFNYIMENWLNNRFKFSKNRSLNLHFLRTKKRERTFEIILSYAKSSFHNSDQGKSELKQLIWLIFMNFCSYKAQYLASIIPKGHKASLEGSIRQFVSFFKAETNSNLKFDINSQVFIFFEKFCKIFSKLSTSDVNTPQIAELIRESNSFENKPKKMFDAFGHKLLGSGVFASMIGFTLNLYDQTRAIQDLSYENNEVSIRKSLNGVIDMSCQFKKIADFLQVPTEFKNFSLKFENCQRLSRLNYGSINEASFNSRGLLKLDLSFNRAANFGDYEMKCLVKGLYFLNHLESLQIFLSWVHLTDKGIMYLQEACKSLINLRKFSFGLEFSHNFTEKSILRLSVVVLVVASYLKKFRLYFCSCKGLYPSAVKNIESLFKSSPSMKVTIRYLLAKNKQMHLFEEPSIFASNRRKNIFEWF